MSNNFVKYLFRNLDFFIANLDTGPSKAKIIAQRVIDPAMEKSAELSAVSPSFMPKGIENLISTNGVIEAKNTIISGGIMIF